MKILCSDPDSGILAFCAAIERLGKPERRLWDRALSRTFDVGYKLAANQSLQAAAASPRS